MLYKDVASLFLRKDESKKTVHGKQTRVCKQDEVVYDYPNWYISNDFLRALQSGLVNISS
jgi:hypothetical protein